MIAQFIDYYLFFENLGEATHTKSESTHRQSYGYFF